MKITVHAQSPINPPPVSPVRPNGYDRCDLTYCRNKPDGYYEVQQCSRNYCRCSGSGTVTKTFSCPVGKHFDRQGPSCRVGDASWCRPKTAPVVPPPAVPWLTPPAFIQSLCNAQNCADRVSAPGPFYPLDSCTPYWCYCSGISGKVMTCPAGQFFDFRSEASACVSRFSLPYCA